MGVVFNKNDYSILALLVEKECFSEIASLSIKQISSATKLSIPKVRLVLKSFLLLNLIAIGAKDNNSNTYYINDKGIQFLNNAMNPNHNNEEYEEE